MPDFRILIVEDNLTFAINLEANLVEWGYEVLGIVDDSTQALKKIQSERPDLVLMDINIKGDLNGIEVTKMIENIDVLVIYMTAERDDGTFESAALTQGISYLVKPFDMLTLKGAIEFSAQRFKKQTQVETDNDYPILFSRKGKELMKIDTSQVLWIEADQNYCDLHFSDKKFVMRTSLKKLFKQLPQDKFIRIHNKFVVRIDAIEGIFLTSSKLKIGNTHLSIGRKYKEELLGKINRH